MDGYEILMGEIMILMISSNSTRVKKKMHMGFPFLLFPQCSPKGKILQG